MKLSTGLSGVAGEYLVAAELSRRGDVAGLADALVYEDWSVREEAAFALGETYDVQAVEPLVAALVDQSCAVRRRLRRNARMPAGGRSPSAYKNA